MREDRLPRGFRVRPDRPSPIRAVLLGTALPLSVLLSACDPGPPDGPDAADEAEPSVWACPDAGSAAPFAGSWEVTFDLAGTAVPGGLELTALEGCPWGRMTARAGPGLVFAVRGMERDGPPDSVVWRFLVGGPARGMRLVFRDGRVAGTFDLAEGQTLGVEGRRTGSDEPDFASAAPLMPLAPGVVSLPDRGESFATEDREGWLYLARHGLDLTDPALVRTRPAGEGWTEPEEVPFAAGQRARSPVADPAGDRLVFATDRPGASAVGAADAPGRQEGDGDGAGYALWEVTRDGAEWSEPRPLRFRGGDPGDARQPALLADGTVVFRLQDRPDGAGEGDLYRARPAEGEDADYGPPEPLGSPPNGPGDEHGAWIAPDGSWMILASGSHPGGQGADDLWLVEREGEGWSTPRNLGPPVSSFGNEYGPWLSRDGRWLYFTSDRYGTADLFRVSTDGLPGVPRGGDR